jgi:two-component sensor histidine kinase
MPSGPTPAKAGLGTSIVQALAKQLGAVVAVTPANPGTQISIIHTTPSGAAHPAAALAAV